MVSLRLLASTTRLDNDLLNSWRSLKRCYVPNCQRTRPDFNAEPLQILCARYPEPRSVLVGLGGLEPPTSPLSGVRSNHLSYRPVVLLAESDHTYGCSRAAGVAGGGASRDRTDDPLLAKQVLSQLSYGPVVLPCRGRSSTGRPRPCGWRLRALDLHEAALRVALCATRSRPS